jgi:hypothetical protein
MKNYDSWKLDNGYDELQWFGDIPAHMIDVFKDGQEYSVVLQSLEVSNGEVINFDIVSILKINTCVAELLPIGEHADFYDIAWDYIFDKHEDIVNANTQYLRRE